MPCRRLRPAELQTWRVDKRSVLFICSYSTFLVPLIRRPRADRFTLARVEPYEFSQFSERPLPDEVAPEVHRTVRQLRL